MDPFVIVLLYLSVFGFLVFVLLLGPSHRCRNTPIGKLNTFLTITLMDWTANAFRRMCGDRINSRWSRVYELVAERRHPALQIFYFILLTGAVAIFYVHCYPYIPGKYVSSAHLIVIPLVIIFTYMAFFLASWSDPGAITRENAARACRLFDYDGLIFPQPNTCRTCLLQKPARSKHCPLCGICIAKADHHCAWINNCVGLNNHRWFLLFIYATIQICAYGTYLIAMVMLGMMDNANLFIAYVIDRTTGARVPLSYYQAFIFFVQRERVLGGLIVFTTLCALLLTVFGCYQLYLVYVGTTTNETFKWEDLEETIFRGDLFVLDAEDEAGVGGKSGRKAKKGGKSTQGKSSVSQYDNRAAEGMTRRKTKTDETETRPSGRRVKSLEELDNIYDKGLIGNFKEVLFPPSLNG